MEDTNTKIINRLIEKERLKENLKISQDDITNISSKETILGMFRKIKSYRDMLEERMTFITKELTGTIPFTKENLYLICAYSGSGKCLSKDTPILMHDGSVKMVQDVVIGDVLMGPDSQPRVVASLARGKEEMYDIIPTKGDKYTVNESHILSLRWSPTRKTHKNFKKNQIVNISVKDYFKMSKYVRSNLKGWRPNFIDFETQEVTLDPYFVGVWLGDGTSSEASITTKDKEIVDFLTNFANQNNMGLRNPIHNGLKKYNLLNNKHIPTEYKCNSKQVRLQLLAGLIDSDGSVGKGGSIDYITKKEELANDIVYICRSLGLAAYKKKSIKRCTNSTKTENHFDVYFRVSISGDIDQIPLRIERKKEMLSERKRIKNVLNTGIRVTPVGVDDYYGFQIEGPDKLFLLGDFTVTHNTTCSANIAYPLWQEGKKVLWISNEENAEDIMMRIACLHMRYNFNEYKKGYMSQTNITECIKLFPEIAKFVHIFDVGYKDGITTKIEGIINILEAAKADGGYSCILMDYFQLIKFSIDNPSRSTYQVLDDLRIYLMRYIKGCNTPVVLFAQLHSLGKRNNKDLDSRIKDGPTIYEAATVVMELLMDKENLTTEFVIHKDRFGLAGNRIKMSFDRGKLTKYDLEFARKVVDQKLDQITESLKEREEGK